jgi:hypothetical protein
MFDITGFSWTENWYQEMVSLTLVLLLSKPIPIEVKENIAKDNYITSAPKYKPF